MKSLKNILFILIVFVLIIFSSACSFTQNENKISTLLKIDTSNSGVREMRYSFAQSKIKNDEDRAEIEKIISTNCPGNLSYIKSEKDGSLTYIFYLNFNTIDDYKNKVHSILGFNPGIIYSVQDNIFANGTEFCENFNSADLLNWINLACSASSNNNISGISSICTDTALCMNGTTKTTDSYINNNSITGTQIDSIKIETENNNGVFDRTFILRIPYSTVKSLGEENILSYINARSIGCSEFSMQSYESGIEYFIKFKNLNLEDISSYTNILLNSQSSGNISYKKSNDYISMFCDENSFDEILDLSSYRSKQNSEVDLDYIYTIENQQNNKIFTAQKYSKGLWKDANELNSASATFDEKVSSFKVNISNGSLYNFSKAKVYLGITDNDFFTRYIDFYLDKDSDKAFENIQNYLKSKNSLFTAEKINIDDNSICRLEFSGNSQELTKAQTNIFGSENTLNINKKANKPYSLHNNSSITDAINLSKIIKDENNNSNLFYTVDTLNGNFVDSLSYSSDGLSSKSINISQSDSKDISFELESFKSIITMNTYSANPFGVFLAFVIVIIFIVVVLFIIVRIKRNTLKLPKINTNKNIKKQKPTDEEILDILKNI